MAAVRKAWLELPDEPAVGWRVVDVVAEDGAFASVRDGAASTRVDRARLSDYDATYEDEALCSDVSRLASLHAAPLVSALARRFRARTTYTNVGDVLIAVNPWRDVPDAPGAPHVRDVATAALEGAVERRASQAIVISGESGAGKTVSATRIIEYLVASGGLGRSRKRESFERREKAKESLLARLGASIPSLEALGNASTGLNDNSSRFGKLVKLSYDGRGGERDVVGASIEEFLLEKARVSRRSRSCAQERNYHFLCQLAGKSGAKRAYAANAKSDDGAKLATTEQAFAALGLDDDVTAFAEAVGEAVLCLGDGDAAAAAAALGVDAAALAVALKERRCAGAGTDATVSVTYEPTEQLRVVDALAKALYAALFGGIVAAANAALAQPLEEVRGSIASPLGERSPNGGSTPRKAGPREAFVGILDIYGFEIFAVNGLDQLLINYANEVLQRSFDDCLLKAEAKRYDDDAVPWDAVDLARCLGSTKVVDLVAAPPRGLLPLLDEQVKLGVRGADAAFLTQADRAHKDCDVYGKPRFDRDKFAVTHYAGAVTYDPAGFLLSNSDPLPVDVAAVLATSSKPRVAALLAPEPGGRSRARSLPQLRESTSRVFRGQMRSLEKTLAACAAPAHYVRCVRPNAAKSPDDFDARLVLGQLTAAGVMDLVKLRGRGFPERVDAAAFVAEFGRGLDGDADAAFAAALAARAPAAAASYAAAKRAEAAALGALDGDAAPDAPPPPPPPPLELDGAEASAVAAALASARLGPGATAESPKRAWCVGAKTGMVYLKKGTLASLRADMRDADARAARLWADAVAAAKRRAEARRLKALADAEAAKRAEAAAAAKRAADLEAARAAEERRLADARAAKAQRDLERAKADAAAALAAKAVAAAKADAARALVGRRLAAVYRGAKVRRNVARAALAAALARNAAVIKDARATSEAVRDEMRTIVGWASKPHATVAALDVALGQAYLRAVAVSATTKTLLDCESRAAVLEAARQTDAATGGFTGSLDAFRGEVYDVIDKSAKIATLVAAEFRRRTHARALRACAARSRPFADFLETNELLVVAKAVRLRKKGLFSTTEVDATAVVSSRGAVRVVVMRSVVGDCDRAGHAIAVSAAPPAGGCCAAGGHVLAGDPGDAPCLVGVDRRDGAKRPKPLRFVDDGEGATRVWRGVAGAVGAADFRCLAPLAILALARE